MAVESYVKSTNLGIKYRERVPFQPDKFKYPIRRYPILKENATDQEVFTVAESIISLTKKDVEDVFRDKTEILRNYP